MNWPSKTPPKGDAQQKKSIGKGVFRKCDACGETITSAQFAKNFEVCPLCGQHHRLGPDGWQSLLLDQGSLAEVWDEQLEAGDPLGFSDGKPYRERLSSARRSAKHRDAMISGRATIGGQPAAFGLFLFGFMGGSMGSVVGEKVALLFERATAQGLPVVLLQASGGARMQEGIFSLMQMAKGVAARERHGAARLPFISVLLHPTTGGVAASFALLGDVHIAEPKALIGFAGPRVIETTIRQKLPEGFQRSEFLLEHGMVDRIVSRLEMRDELTRLLKHLSPPSARP